MKGNNREGRKTLNNSLSHEASIHEGIQGRRLRSQTKRDKKRRKSMDHLIALEKTNIQVEDFFSTRFLSYHML
jgi:hypothetical protein